MADLDTDYKQARELSNDATMLKAFSEDAKAQLIREGPPAPAAAAPAPAKPAAPSTNAPRGGGESNVALDYAGQAAKLAGGVTKAVTLGAIDPISGTVGVPFVGARHQVLPRMSDSLKDLGVTESVADDEWSSWGGEMIGSYAPYRVVAGVFTSLTTKLLNMGRGTAVAAPGSLEVMSKGRVLLEDAWKGLVQSSQRIGVAGATNTLLTTAQNAELPVHERMGAARDAFLMGGLTQGLFEAWAPVLTQNVARIKSQLGYGTSVEGNLRTIQDGVERIIQQVYGKGYKGPIEPLRAQTMNRVAAELGPDALKPGAKMSDVKGMKAEQKFNKATDVTPKPTEGTAAKPNQPTAPPPPLTPAQADMVKRAASPSPLQYGWQTPKQVDKSLTEKNFLIITTDNPGVNPNAPLNTPEKLVQELLSRGYLPEEIHPTDGRYGGPPEGSFMIEGMPPEEAQDIITQTGQSDGYIRGGMLSHDGMFLPPSGPTVYGKDAVATGFYSTIKGTNGEVTFSTPFDFDAPRQPYAIPESVSQKVEQPAAPVDQNLVDTGRAYLAGVHAPNDPAVKASYDALKQHIVERYRQLEAEGYKLSAGEGTPYQSSKEMFADLEGTKNLRTSTDNPTPPDHPLSEEVPGMPGTTYNTLFRFVHDIDDHFVGGMHDFDLKGETDAWMKARGNVPEAARGAYDTEIYGQLAAGETLNPPGKILDQRKYAEQKAMLLPADLMQKTGQSAGEIQIQGLDAEIEGLKAEIAQAGEGVDAEKKIEETIAAIDEVLEKRAKVLLNEIKGDESKGASFYDKVDRMADKASQRLKERFAGRVQEGITAAIPMTVGTLKDLSIIGVSLLARGFKSNRAFANALSEAISQDLTPDEVAKVRTRAEKSFGTLVKNAGGQFSSVEHLLEMYEMGKDGGKWYNKAWETLQWFVGGDTLEAKKAARTLAALSQGMGPKRNISMFLDVWHAYKVGDAELLEKALGRHPYPTAIVNAKRALNDESFGEHSFKVEPFSQNLMGNLKAVTIDRRMKRVLGLPINYTLNDSQQAALTDFFQEITPEGVEPAEFQAAVWKADGIIKAADEEAKGFGGSVQEYLDSNNKNFDQIFMDELVEFSERLKAKGFTLDEKGAANAYLVFTLGRILAGAAVGALEGDTMEERVQNAIIGGAAFGAAPGALRMIGRLGARIIGSKNNIKAVTKIMNETGLADDLLRTFNPKGMGRPSVPPPVGVQAGAVPTSGNANGAAIQQGTASPGTVAPTPGVTGPVPVEPQPVKPVELFEVLKADAAKRMMELDPSTIDLGDRTLKINYDEVAGPEDVERILKFLTTENAARIDAARRGTMSIPRIKELARKSGLDFDTIMSRRRGQALNAEETQSLIDLHGSVLKETSGAIHDLAANPGEPELEDKLTKILNTHSMVLDQVYGARAEWGRTGPVWGTDAQGYISVSTKLATTLATTGYSKAAEAGEKRATKITPTRLAALLIAHIKSPKELSTWIDNATRPSKTDMVLEAMYGGFFLSNPATLTTNALGGALTSVFAIPERFLAAGIGSAIKTLEAGGIMAPSADHVTGSEAAAFAYGMMNSIDQALQIAGHAFKTGERGMAGTKLEMAPTEAITAENMGKSGPLGNLIDFLGGSIRLPLRGLLSTDEFFKVINAFAEIQADGHRKSAAQGLEGNDAAKFLVDFFGNLPVESIENAQNFSAYQTFTQQLGPGMQNVQRAIESMATRYKIPVKFTIPFITTPTNIFKFVIERTPLAFMHQGFRDDISAGGARRDLALAKLAMGSALLLTAGYYALQGRCDGHAPLKPSVREMGQAGGRQEYSCTVGEEQISFNRMDPYGMILGLGADWAQWIYGGSEKQGFSPEKIFLHGVLPIAWNLSSKTYLEGATRLLRGLAAQDATDVKALLKGVAGAFVPGFVRQIQRTGIANDRHFKDARGMWDAYLSQVPGVSDSVKSERDAFGNVVIKPGGLGPDLISGIAVSKLKNEPHYKAMIENEIGLTPPERMIFGHAESDMAQDPDPDDGIELSETEYERLQILAGNAEKLDGKGFEDMIKDYITTEDWNGRTKYGRQKQVQKIHAVYKKAARNRLLYESKDLQRKVQAKRDERVIKQLQPR